MKSGVKVVVVICGFIVFLIAGVLIGMAIPSQKEEEKEPEKKEEPAIEEVYAVKTSEIEGCGHKKTLYYEGVNQNVYLYCLEDIMLQDDEKEVSLKEYIDSNGKDIEKSMQIFVNHDKLWDDSVSPLEDGGTVIYKDSGITKVTNNGLTMIKCASSNGGTDVYFGPYNMKYQNSYCDPTIEDKLFFTKTYNVLFTVEGDDPKYVYLTLKQFQNDDVRTVKVLKERAKDVKANNNYEFTFQYKDKYIDDKSIDSVFENANLVTVVLTKKTGTDQIQENAE